MCPSNPLGVSWVHVALNLRKAKQGNDGFSQVPWNLATGPGGCFRRFRRCGEFFLQRLGSYFEGFMIRVGCFVIQDECKARFLDRTAFLRTVRCFLKDYQDYQLQPFHHKNTGTIFLITQLTADITSHPTGLSGGGQQPFLPWGTQPRDQGESWTRYWTSNESLQCHGMSKPTCFEGSGRRVWCFNRRGHDC